MLRIRALLSGFVLGPVIFGSPPYKKHRRHQVFTGTWAPKVCKNTTAPNLLNLAQKAIILHTSRVKYVYIYVISPLRTALGCSSQVARGYAPKTVLDHASRVPGHWRLQGDRKYKCHTTRSCIHVHIYLLYALWQLLRAVGDDWAGRCLK